MIESKTVYEILTEERKKSAKQEYINGKEIRFRKNKNGKFCCSKIKFEKSVECIYFYNQYDNYFYEIDLKEISDARMWDWTWHMARKNRVTPKVLYSVVFLCQMLYFEGYTIGHRRGHKQ